MQYLTVWDLVLTPIYLLILTFIAKRIRDKRYPVGHPLRKYYLPGLWVKFGGVIFIALVYQFYYGSGDTFNFYEHSKIINSSLHESPSIWIKLIFRLPYANNPELYAYISNMYWYNSPPEYIVAIIGAIFGLLNNTTYIPIALLFAFFTYSGIWAMFRTFTNLYPKATNLLAIAFLFIPSTIVWGSAIFKDTICMFALGWMTYTTFRIFVNKDFSLKNILLLVLSFYLIAQIKIYILLGFLPALALWLLMNYSKKITSVTLRWITNIAFLAIIVGGFIFFTDRFTTELNRYSLERIAYTVQVTQGWTTFAAGDEGSVYNIGQIDGTLESMFSLFPQAVVVTLFRPFPWEAQKIIIVFSMLEAMVFLYFTIRVFFNRKGKPLKNLFTDPNILFCFVFAIIFAFAVGISSGNFGALSRYKIPCLPFYAAVLAIIMSKQRQGIKKEKLTVVYNRPQPAI